MRAFSGRLADLAVLTNAPWHLHTTMAHTLSHDETQTYQTLLILASRLAFKIDLDISSKMASPTLTLTPRGISSGGSLVVVLSKHTPNQAKSLFASYYGMKEPAKRGPKTTRRFRERDRIKSKTHRIPMHQPLAGESNDKEDKQARRRAE